MPAAVYALSRFCQCDVVVIRVKLNLILIVGILLTTAVAITLWLLDIKRTKTLSNQTTNTK